MTAPGASGEVDLGDLSDLADGELRSFADVGDHGVVVCRVAGQLHALSDNCSHADTRLSEGRLQGAQLVCPLHGAAFDVRDGSHQSPPAWEGVPCFPIDEGPGGVVVDLSADSAGDADEPTPGHLRTR